MVQTDTLDAAAGRAGMKPNPQSYPTEFNCSDCGVHVELLRPPPMPGDRCPNCQWIAAITDPERRAAMRSQLIEHAAIGAPLP